MTEPRDSLQLEPVRVLRGVELGVGQVRVVKAYPQKLGVGVGGGSEGGGRGRGRVMDRASHPHPTKVIELATLTLPR